MKQIILIMSVCLSLFMYSCSDDNLAGVPEKEGYDGKRNITFALSTGDNNDFNVTTRAKGTVVTDDYAVKFYLFKRNADDKYELIKKENITQPLYTIENLDIEGSYKYAFIATSIANQTALDAMDFSSVTWDSNSFNVTIPNDASTGSKSILENCFISFFDDRSQSIPTFDTDENITINRDLDIFGYGSFLAPGMTFNTPINVIMERQFGIVECIFPDAQPGDKLICSFSSEYYRLYLSQFVINKTDKNSKITSDNFGSIPDNIFTDAGLSKYTQGDYYSASGLYKSMYGTLPIFTKSKEIKAGEKSIQLYMPYTTATVVGTTSVGDIYKANYIRTELTDPDGVIIKGKKGSITLKVERGGATLATYTSDTAFPIYRNGKTIFTAAQGYLQVNFGPADAATDDGIHLDGDGWHGDITN